ncbi:MAG: 3-dehydroquinate synthase [Bacillota bacterium]
MKVVLVGFMGSGKTRVGCELSRLLNVPLVDTDLLVEETEGITIREIFSRWGEEGFRERERVAVRRASRLKNIVIATGGGAWLDPNNRRALGRESVSVYLQVTPEAVTERLGEDGKRPLLRVDDPRAEIRRLLEEREEAYLEADMHVPTDDASPEEIARLIAERVGFPTPTPVKARELWVDVSPPYRLVVGAGLSHEMPLLLEECGVSPGTGMLGTDKTVDHLYGQLWKDALASAGFDPISRAVTPGENSKSLEEASRLLDAFLSRDPDRDTPVMALGGGVVGDLFGLVAAIALRGVPLVGIPTTLLSQVDSSVGGKVAVNHSRGKNLIGAFHQPRLVVADIDFLMTLPEEEFVGGMAEVAKHGLLDGGEYLEMLRSRFAALRRREPAALVEAVTGSCRLKASYVSEDEREAGIRTHLNLGHTAAHALETASGGAISHGRAVGYGLGVALRLSERLGYLAEADRAEMEEFLAPWGFAGALDAFSDAPDVESVAAAMASDKKRRGDRLRWVLLRGVGRAIVVDDVPQTEVLAALKGE